MSGYPWLVLEKQASGVGLAGDMRVQLRGPVGLARLPSCSCCCHRSDRTPRTGAGSAADWGRFREGGGLGGGPPREGGEGGPGWLGWSREEGWQMGILDLGVDPEGGNELGLRAWGRCRNLGSAQEICGHLIIFKTVTRFSLAGN